MKAMIIFSLSSLLCIGYPMLEAQETNPGIAIKDFLKTFRSTYIESMLEGKPERIEAYYHDDIRLMVEYQRTMIGKENAALYHRMYADRFRILSYKRSELEVLDLGERIVEHGMMSIQLRVKKTNEIVDLNGKYQNIWKKDEQGKLMLITEGWNFDHSVAIGEDLKFPEIPTVNVALQSHLPVDSNISFELAALNHLEELAISQHDVNLWSRFYTDDAIIFAQREPAQQGRRMIDQYIYKHMKEMPVFENLSIRNDRIDYLGKYVIEYASHIAVWRGGEYSGVGLGKDVRIWRRETDGSLKIFRHIGMYD